MEIQKMCSYCWKEFTAWCKSALYCSAHCRDENRKKRDKIFRDRKCKYCWKIFQWTRETNVCEECLKQLKSKAWKISHQVMDEEEKKRRSQISRENMLKNWTIRTDEQKEELNRKKVEWWRKWMHNKTNEERKEMMDKLTKKSIEWRKNVSKEEFKKVEEKRVASWKKTYAKKSKEEKKEWRGKIVDATKQTIANYTEEEYDNYIQIHIDAMNKWAGERLKTKWYAYPCQYPHVRESSKTYSKTNQEWENLLLNMWMDVEHEFAIWRYSYDLKVWNILLEINPYAYHNTTFIPNPQKNKIKKENYHMDKCSTARENWYRCIIVWDWDNKEKIINFLLPKQNIYARNCVIKKIDKDTANNFLNAYHLQNSLRHKNTTIYLWLYYKEKLIMVMTFWKPRYNSNYEVELLRLCTHKDYTVIWWASKLFKYYINNYKPNSIISYCDMSKFDWRVYEQLWFTQLWILKPSRHRWYTWSGKIKCPNHITNMELNSKGFDKLLWDFFWYYWHGTNNEELIQKHKYVSIYDAGQKTFVRKNEETQGSTVVEN